MSPEELYEKATAAAINRRALQLVIPRRARGHRITLAGRGTPMSVDLMANPLRPQETVAWFNPNDVLWWLHCEGSEKKS